MTLRLLLRAASLAVASIALLMPPSPARAHGGMPQSQILLFHPTDPDTIVVSATFGLLVTHDAGETWDWVCVQSIPSGRLGFTDPIVLLPDGAVVVAQYTGLYRGDLYGCSWQAAAALEGMYVADVILEPGSDSTILALQSAAATTNRVFRSTDGGRTLVPASGPLPVGYLPERLRVAPTDLDAQYISGAFPATAETEKRIAVFSSSNGGATWTEHAFELLPGELDLFLLEVGPEDPLRVFGWVRGEVTDRLVVSDDGGATFTDVDTISAYAVPIGRPFGFAIAPDDTLYFGNTMRGIYRSEDMVSSELVARGMQNACLAFHDDELWACANGIADGFSVGRSPVPKLMFEPVLEFDEVTGPRACGGEVEAECHMWWNDLLRDLGRPVPDGGVAPDAGLADGSVLPMLDGAPGLRDGGAPLDGPSVTPGGGGCDCGVAGAPEAPPAGALAVATLVVALLSAARARGSRRARSRRG